MTDSVGSLQRRNRRWRLLGVIIATGFLKANELFAFFDLLDLVRLSGDTLLFGVVSSSPPSDLREPISRS